MIIVGNGRLITRRKEHPYYEDGAVVLKDSTIQAIGTTNEIRAGYPKAEFIDAKGMLIMPAFINAHEHSYSAMARGLSMPGYHPTGFLDILDGMWWKLDRHLTLEQVRQSARETFYECIRNGVTTVFDHHASYSQVQGSLFAIEDAAKEFGIRTCLCYEVSDREGGSQANAAIRENLEYIRHCKEAKDPLRAAMMGLHASFTLSNETLEICAENTPVSVGFHIHAAEGIEDLHHSLKTYGKRIVDRLMDFNLLGEKTIAAHGIFVNQHEMELLKATDTCVVHNPESNMGNACGCPPAILMMKLGIVTGLGTDGYTHDMMESYKVGNLLHKHSLCDPNAAWDELPRMLFENNPKIAKRQFGQTIGILEPGATADVIIVEYDPPTPMNESNYNSHLLFGINGSNVITTICNGKVVMKDRILPGIDQEQLLANVRAEAQKLWDTL